MERKTSRNPFSSTNMNFNTGFKVASLNESVISETYSKKPFNLSFSSEQVEKSSQIASSTEIDKLEAVSAEMSAADTKLSNRMGQSVEKASDMNTTLELVKAQGIERETIEQAIRFNRDGENDYPFYLKVFDNEEVKEGSSLMKTEDKEKYITGFGSIIADDAKLEKITSFNKEVKEKAREQLENLLMTEIEIESKRETKKKLHDPKKRPENKLIEKCKEAIQSYNKEDLNEMKDKIGSSYEKYKQLMGKKVKNFLERNKKTNVEAIMRKFQTVVRDSTLKELEEAVVDNTIEKLDLSDKSTFGQVELGYLDTGSLNRLLEIENKLGLEEVKGNLSECKQIFLTGKTRYQEEAKKRGKVVPKDPKKIDYLKEMKEKRDLEKKMRDFDDQICVFS